MKHNHPLIFTLIISIILLACPAMQCFAEPADHGITGENRAVEMFDGSAEMLVRDGCEFLDAAGYYDYWGYSDDYSFEDFVYIFPVSDDENWEMCIYINDVGHLDGLYELNGKMILQRYYDQYDGEVEFYYAPVFDTEKSKWSWCVSIENPGASPYFIYQEIILMREGCLCVYLYISPQDLNAGLIEYAENAITIMPGGRYEDFDPAFDDVCDFDFFGLYFYGDGDSDFQEPQYPDDDISGWTFDFPVRNLGTVLIIAIAVMLRLKVGRKPKAGKDKANRTKIPKNKPKNKSLTKPVVLRKTYDEEDRTDSRDYYLRMREEEDRRANRYD